MVKSVIGLVLGLVLGYFAPVTIPMAYSKLFSVILLAMLDAVLGGLRATMSHEFDDMVFISGFFTNGLLAAILVYIGDHLGIDLYYVALLAFGIRMFQNLSLLRREILKR